MTAQHATAGEIGAVLGVSTRAVHKRAQKEGWDAVAINARGDRRFVLDALPAALRARVIQARESAYQKGMILPSRADLDLAQAKELLRMFDAAPAWSRRRAEARGEIVDAFGRFAAGAALTEAKHTFINRYNTNNNHLGISPETYQLFGTISRASLDSWRAKKKELGLCGLLESTARGKPPTRLTPDMHHYIIGLISDKPHRRPRRVYEYLIDKFSGEAGLPSEATVRRFIARWKQEHTQEYAFLKNPDEWRRRFQAAFGDASEKATHYLDMLEFDNTPADIMCADKRRYTITAAIDIYTRKAKCLVVPTSRSQAIANLMRWIILNWGLFDVMIADNGKDYASKHIEAACGALGIELPPVPPFAPEKKPHIERFFGTLSVMLFEELSGYIGHSVADRKELESRKSFAQRMFDKDEVIECRLMPDELQQTIDTWVDKVYHQRTHSRLGMSPEQKVGENARPVKKILDERALDILLAPTGRPTVQTKGIRYQRGVYWAPELADHIGRRVQIRRDLADAGTLHVFDLEARFVCVATDAALEGVTVEEATVARKHQRKQLTAQVRALRTLAKEVGDPMSDLLARKRAAKGQVAGFQRSEAWENDALREAGKGVKSREQRAESRERGAQSREQRAKSTEQGVENYGQRTTDDGPRTNVVSLREEEPWFDSSLDKYKYLTQQAKVRDLTEREEGWIEGYKATEEYYKVFVMPYE